MVTAPMVREFTDKDGSTGTVYAVAVHTSVLKASAHDETLMTREHVRVHLDDDHDDEE